MEVARRPDVCTRSDESFFCRGSHELLTKRLISFPFEYLLADICAGWPRG
jgi:hypothetical protein